MLAASPPRPMKTLLPRAGGGLRRFTLIFRTNTEAPACAGEQQVLCHA